MARVNERKMGGPRLLPRGKKGEECRESLEGSTEKK